MIPWGKPLCLRCLLLQKEQKAVGTELLSRDAMEVPMAGDVAESTMQLLVAPSRQMQASCHQLTWVHPASYAIQEFQFLLDLG